MKTVQPTLRLLGWKPASSSVRCRVKGSKHQLVVSIGTNAQVVDDNLLKEFGVKIRESYIQMFMDTAAKPNVVKPYELVRARSR